MVAILKGCLWSCVGVRLCLALMAGSSATDVDESFLKAATKCRVLQEICLRRGLDGAGTITGEQSRLFPLGTEESKANSD